MKNHITPKAKRSVILFGVSILLILLVTACTTQIIHFHEITPNKLSNVINQNSLFNSQNTYYLKGVTGGPYPESPYEFSTAVWHIVIKGYHSQFVKLPVKDVNRAILEAYRRVLTTSGIKLVESAKEADYVVEFSVQKIILKTQSTPGFDYTACLTHMTATSQKNGQQKRQFDLEGIAKVEKARVKIRTNDLNKKAKGSPDFSAFLNYVFGSPTIFELSLAEGLKTLNTSGNAVGPS